MVLVCFVVGIGIGFLLRSRKNLQKWVGKLTDVVVCALLFLLGVSIGSSSDIIENLSSLGLQAFVLSFGAVAGSILAMLPINSLFFKDNK